MENRASKIQVSLVQKRGNDCPHHPHKDRWVANVDAPDPERERSLQVCQSQLVEHGVHLIKRTTGGAGTTKRHTWLYTSKEAVVVVVVVVKL